MKCGFCPEIFMSEDDLDTHMDEKHPEFSIIGEEKFKRKTTSWAISMGLTACTLAQRKEVTKEETLETFKYFLRELMKSET